MSNVFYPSNNLQTRQIYNLIENIENKMIQKSARINNKRYQSTNNIQPFSKEINPSYSYNLISNQKNMQNSQLTNYELRKIIKEEFESLYRPYHSEIENNFNRLRGEINNIYQLNNDDRIKDIKNDKYDIEIALKEIKKTLFNYVSFNEYNKKLNELEEKINFKNSKNDNFIINKMNNLNEEIEQIKSKFNEINNRLNNNYNFNEFNQNNNNIQLNDLKLKDLINKNSFLQKDLENLKEEMDKFKNKVNSSIIDKNKILNELEFKCNSLNVYENKHNIINNDLKRIKESIKDINRTNEEIKNSINFNNTYNLRNNNSYNANENVEQKINYILQKLDLTSLDTNKFRQVCDGYEKLLNNYINISKIVAHINTAIKELNTKIQNMKPNENNNTISLNSDIKTDILLVNRKNEFLERQFQYLQDKVERLSIDAMKINNSSNDFIFKKENILLMQKDIEKIKQEIYMNNKSVEEEKIKIEKNIDRIQKIENDLKEGKIKGEQNIERIEKIESELKEENNKKNEEKVYKIQEENRI